MRLRMISGLVGVAVAAALGLIGSTASRADETVQFTVPTTYTAPVVDGSTFTDEAPLSSVDLPINTGVVMPFYAFTTPVTPAATIPYEGSVSFDLTIDGSTQTFTQDYFVSTTYADPIFDGGGPYLYYTLADGDQLTVAPDTLGNTTPGATFILEAPAPTPEPASLTGIGLGALGLLGLALRARKRSGAAAG